MKVIEIHFVIDRENHFGTPVDVIKKAHVLGGGSNKIVLEHHDGKRIVYEVITRDKFDNMISVGV